MTIPATEPLRIGNCSGAFGDRLSGARELLEHTHLDVLTGDWLAEVTMDVLQKLQARDPLKGYATTFLSVVEDVLGLCLESGTRIVSNAGGLNPEGCADALDALVSRLGLSARVGYVTGDNLMSEVAELSRTGALRRFPDGELIDLDADMPLSANAYLGGGGIASCLERGADIVVTGRTTDAALVIGPAMWHFGWKQTDWDQLAGALVAGHVIECGCQATGGNFSFFEEVPGGQRLSFPIAEIDADGSSVITKPPETAGAVTVETVTAQLIYEVEGPRYLNPDVVARLDSIELTPDGPDRVRIRGVIGEPPPSTLKVSMAMHGGYRNDFSLVITGDRVAAKADYAQRAVWELIPGGRAAFDEVNVELLGSVAEDPETFGAATALLRFSVASSDPEVAGRAFSSAFIQTGLSGYPGLYFAGLPGPAKSFSRFTPATIPAELCSAHAVVDGVEVIVSSVGAQYGADYPGDAGAGATAQPSSATTNSTSDSTQRVPLGRVVGARSGDKGGNANLGFWVRSSEAFGWLVESVDVDLIRSIVPPAADLEVERWVFPNLNAVNFVIKGMLGTGASAFLGFDRQAKGLGEYARSRYVEVPSRLLKEGAT